MRRPCIYGGTQGDGKTSWLELLLDGSRDEELGGQSPLSGPSAKSGISGIQSGRRLRQQEKAEPPKGAAPRRGAWRRSRPLSQDWTSAEVSVLVVFWRSA